MLVALQLLCPGLPLVGILGSLLIRLHQQWRLANLHGTC